MTPKTIRILELQQKILNLQDEYKDIAEISFDITYNKSSTKSEGKR